jgi:hypothetical protein
MGLDSQIISGINSYLTFRFQFISSYIDSFRDDHHVIEKII